MVRVLLILLILNKPALYAVSNIDSIGIFLQNGFENERVEIVYNGISVYNELTKTDANIGLSAVVYFKMVRGVDTIELIINDQRRIIQIMPRKKFIEIDHIGDLQLKVSYSNKMRLYD